MMMIAVMTLVMSTTVAPIIIGIIVSRKKKIHIFGNVTVHNYINTVGMISFSYSHELSCKLWMWCRERLDTIKM